MANVFYPRTKENVQLSNFLLMDTHLSYHVHQFCREKGINLVALFPNATHLLQPMDVAMFTTIKSGWKEQVHQWNVYHQNEPLRLRNFALLLKLALKNCITSIIFQNGFGKCGLFPWNSSVVENFSICKHIAEGVTDDNTGNDNRRHKFQ